HPARPSRTTAAHPRPSAPAAARAASPGAPQSPPQLPPASPSLINLVVLLAQSRAFHSPLSTHHLPLVTATRHSSSLHRLQANCNLAICLRELRQLGELAVPVEPAQLGLDRFAGGKPSRFLIGDRGVERLGGFAGHLPERKRARLDRGRQA